jgi:hypothetical protein
MDVGDVGTNETCGRDGEKNAGNGIRGMGTYMSKCICIDIIRHCMYAHHVYIDT